MFCLVLIDSVLLNFACVWILYRHVDMASRCHVVLPLLVDIVSRSHAVLPGHVDLASRSHVVLLTKHHVVI